jgi:hypothetical protein
VQKKYCTFGTAAAGSRHLTSLTDLTFATMKKVHQLKLIFLDVFLVTTFSLLVPASAVLILVELAAVATDGCHIYEQGTRNKCEWKGFRIL